MTEKKTSLRVAIIQESPVYLNLKQSFEKAEILIKEAVDRGANLIVFGETWLCGYPAWLDHCPGVALWGHEPTKAVFARMFENAVTVPGKETKWLSKWAQIHKVTMVMGLNEKVTTGRANGTIFNSFLVFSPNGKLANHHRKLIPTYTEKLLYGLGDGQGLKSVETPFGRVGGLICWEHWMPLARQAMHDSGELIHIALWPSVHEIHQIASRHYAFEGRCFVVSVGQIMRVKDIPPELDVPETLRSEPEEYLLNGGSCVVAPDGFYDLKPQFGTEGIIIHDIDDPAHAYRERMTMDVTGHYQRPDVFRFDLIQRGGR